MKRIEIHHKKDLEKLKELKGKEYIFLKIYPEFTSCTVDAITLSQFQGTIDISFADPNKPLFYQVVTSRKGKYRAFFDNVQNYQVILPMKPIVNFNYRYKKIYQHVSSESELKKAMKQAKELEIVLTEDLVLTKPLPETLSKITANQDRIYYTKENENQVASIMNIQPILVDKIIEIRSIEDFKILTSLTSETVVVTIQKNITNFYLETISLENFTGTMYFLGNYHSLSQGIIIGKRRVGLFSKIHPYGTVHFSNYTLEKIKYTGERTIYTGGFLGARPIFPKNAYCSSFGKIEFYNCHIRNCYFAVSGKVNPFVGRPDPDFFFHNCSAHHLQLFNEAVKLTSFDGYYVQTIPSQTEHHEFYISYGYDGGYQLTKKKY